jgi:hypothetical protein
MPGLALLLLVLAACSSNDTTPGESSDAPVPMQGWRTERGAVPTQAEFAAVVASCQDQAKAPGDLDSCLRDMGLRRSQ